MNPLMVCLMSLLVFVQAGAAQQATVAGQVRLAGGLPVAEAQVMLFDLSDLRRGVVVQATTDADGLFALPLAALGGAVALPEGFALGANYPNPFNPATIIPYQLAATAQVRLEVFNALGQRMALLVEGEQGAGTYQARWDATDAVGRAAAAGVYLYRLTVASTGSADRGSQTGRMVLVDGQAGFDKLSPRGGGSSLRAEPVEVRPVEATGSSYGLVVAGEGLVAYIDADFRVAQGMEPVAIEVEAQPDVRMKVVQSGILGDVDNNGQVDTADGLLVAMYLANPSISMPNNVDIFRGDVNCDRRTDWMDAWLIVTYSIDPSDPAVQSLEIGQSGGCGEEEVREGGNTAATRMYWVGRGYENDRDQVIRRANVDGSDVQDSVFTSRRNIHNLVFDGTQGKMYWINDRTIQRANLDGSDVENLVTESDYGVDRLILDGTRDKMYWITKKDRDRQVIRRANVDGLNVQELIVLGSLKNLTLDVAGDKMYWIEEIRGVYTIRRANVDGSNYVQTLFISLNYLYSFALDVVGGKMYWINGSEEAIQNENLGGSNAEDLVIGLGRINNLVLDIAGGRMYWINNERKAIQRADLDGFNARNLVSESEANNLYNLVLDTVGGKMYWIRTNDDDTDTIQRANLDGSNVQDLVTEPTLWYRSFTLLFP